MSELLVNSKSYQTLLADLKQRIRTAQVRAALAVNRELVLLYWGSEKRSWRGKTMRVGERR